MLFRRLLCGLAVVVLIPVVASSPAAAAPSLTVTPNSNLSGGDEVTVAATGLTPNVQAVLCLGVLPEGAAASNPCAASQGGTPQSTGNSGSITGENTLPRFIYVASLARWIDCADPAETCAFVVFETSNMATTLRTQVLDFAPPPAPPAQRGTITLSPAAGFLHGQNIGVRGQGFRPNRRFSIVQCVAAPDHPSDCGLTIGDGTTNADGTIDWGAIVRGALTRFDAPPVSCAAPQSCTLAVFESADFVGTVASQPLTFSADFTVAPAFAPVGSRVTVTGHGLPGGGYPMCQVYDGWESGWLGCGTAEVGVADADAQEDFSTTLRVDRYLVHHGSESPFGSATVLTDCATQACVVGIDFYNDGLKRSWPVLLAPIPPPPAQRGAIEVSPTSGVAAGSNVSVTGSGFRPNASVDVLQCRPTIDNIADCNPPTRVQADATGSFITSTKVSDLVGPSSQVIDQPYDCAFAANQCVIAAAEEVDFEHTVVSEPIGVVVTATIYPGFGSAGEDESSVSVPLRLSRAVPVPVSVQWSTVVLGTTDEATAGEDYEPASGTVTFQPGATQAAASVKLLDDTIDEPRESVYLQFSAPVNGVLQGNGLIAAVVQDNDPAPLVKPVNTSVVEGDTGSKSVDVEFTLSNPSSRTVTATWKTVIPSPQFAPPAQSGVDFGPANGTLTFPPGTTTQHATVVVTGDIDAEMNERFGVSLGIPTNATRAAGLKHVAWVRIVDDDTPELIPGVSSVVERNSGTAELHVPFSLADAATMPVTVNWETRFVSGAAGSQAEPPDDYAATSGSAVLQPGETSGTASVVVNGDTTPEPDEYVLVIFSSPTSGVRIGGVYGIGLGTITNDD